jgi:hypothetical protein
MLAGLRVLVLPEMLNGILAVYGAVAEPPFRRRGIC